MRNLTKYLLRSSSLLASSFSGFGRKPGTPGYLLEKRGFKIFKLGDPIKKYRKHVKLAYE